MICLIIARLFGMTLQGNSTFPAPDFSEPRVKNKLHASFVFSQQFTTTFIMSVYRDFTVTITKILPRLFYIIFTKYLLQILPHFSKKYKKKF